MCLGAHAFSAAALAGSRASYCVWVACPRPVARSRRTVRLLNELPPNVVQHTTFFLALRGITPRSVTITPRNANATSAYTVQFMVTGRIH